MRWRNPSPPKNQIIRSPRSPRENSLQQKPPSFPCPHCPHGKWNRRIYYHWYPMIILWLSLLLNQFKPYESTLFQSLPIHRQVFHGPTPKSVLFAGPCWRPGPGLGLGLRCCWDEATSSACSNCFMWIHIYISIYLSIYLSIYVCMYVCMCVYTYPHTHIYSYICVHMCTHTYIYIYIDIQIYIYLCRYIQLFLMHSGLKLGRG